MSAILVLPQRSAVHMLTDGVVYDSNGVITVANLTKAFSLPTFPAAVACTGPAFLTAAIAQILALDFASLDDFVDRGAAWLVKMFDDLAEKHCGGNAASTFYIIGWSKKQGRPAAYCADLWTDKSSRIEHILANSDASVARGKLIEQTTIAGTPLNPALAESCGFEIRRNDKYSEIDLLHLAEIARQEEIEGAHWVGGKLLLTTVDACGVHQRVIHEWPDKAGEKIEPRPIDWKRWRRELKRAA